MVDTASWFDKTPACSQLRSFSRILSNCATIFLSSFLSNLPCQSGFGRNRNPRQVTSTTSHDRRTTAPESPRLGRLLRDQSNEREETRHGAAVSAVYCAKVESSHRHHTRPQRIGPSSKTHSHNNGAHVVSRRQQSVLLKAVAPIAAEVPSETPAGADA